MAIVKTGYQGDVKTLFFQTNYQSLKEAVKKVTLSFGYLISHTNDTFGEMIAFKDRNTISYSFIIKENLVGLEIIYEDTNIFRKKGIAFVNELYKCICRLQPARREL